MLPLCVAALDVAEVGLWEGGVCFSHSVTFIERSCHHPAVWSRVPKKKNSRKIDTIKLLIRRFWQNLSVTSMSEQTQKQQQQQASSWTKGGAILFFFYYHGCCCNLCFIQLLSLFSKDVPWGSEEGFFLILSLQMSVSHPHDESSAHQVIHGDGEH